MGNFNMYIKQVLIEGFKSYREQIAIEPFSPKVNCVVGANGSGKSNFFDAILFVISDVFHNLPSEKRQALLHEGVGHQVLSAFVEIVFDNSDYRIPVDNVEVRLRRTISVKKDEYFLDAIRKTKTEVMDLLESAGFSRYNPYYVVQQGKIESLTSMTDSKRLDLLKEIGGVGVYDERRLKSLEILQKTDLKRKQIIQVVQYLDDRLRELDKEKEELEKYQQLDKQRKSLEYVIYDKKLHDAKQKLEEIEEDQKEVSEKSAEMYNSFSDAHEKYKELKKKLKNMTEQAQELSREKETIEEQRTEAIRKRAKLELDDKDLHDNIKGNIKAKEVAVIQLKVLDKEIQSSFTELDRIKQLYDIQVTEEKNLTRGIMEREKQLSILYQKQGRATQFDSRAARDQLLHKESRDIEEVLSSNLVQERKLREEIEQLEKDAREHDARIESTKSESAALESQISGYRQENNQCKAERDRLHEERKSLWKRENKVSAEIGGLKSEVVKAEKSLEHATPVDIRRGLNSVRKICREYDIGGVFGPVFELLDCGEKFFTAVEVAAGNSLFHVVVENDDISTEIIGHLNAQKGGRVTFIPLNRVKAHHTECPQSSDGEPLLKKLKFSPKYASAFAQVFGKTIICQNLDVATRVARTYGLDCITLEGDQVNKKGGMTGGFTDYRRSKLKFINTIRRNRKSIKMKEDELENVRRQLGEIDQVISDLVAKLQKNDVKQAHEKSMLKQLRQETNNAEKQKHWTSKSLENKTKSLSNILIQIDQNRANIAMKQDEMGTELVDHLTPEEKESLSRLNPEITNLKEQLSTCKNNRMETETRKEELEMDLSTNLVRRKEELEAIKQSTEIDMLQGEADLKRQELMKANSLVDRLTQELKRVSESIDQRHRELEEIKLEKDHAKILEDKYQCTLQDKAKELEQLLSKKNVYLSKQEQYSKKIWELGPLSSDSFKTESIKELYKLLHKCNEQLQQFSHVNRTALNQYVSFIEQREELQGRQAELDVGDEKIKELISVLDGKKDESIQRTFKGVAKHFGDVFSELVQGGHGSLFLVNKKDNNDVDIDQDNDEPRPADIEGRIKKYLGVKVKVSFTGQGQTQSMKQLSGGQKTMVALALIFAIQRCVAAPVCLFDEIDAALDPQYRNVVGNMVSRLADVASTPTRTTTQFITTTFSPELVKVANKIYGVTHENRVSHVDVVSKEDAVKFINNDQSRKV